MLLAHMKGIYKKPYKPFVAIPFLGMQHLSPKNLKSSLSFELVEPEFEPFKGLGTSKKKRKL